MSYSALKQKQLDELNSFEGIFFAFSQSQFKEEMKKVGLKPGEDEDKLLSLGAGGYILKERKDAFFSLFDRHERELMEFYKDQKNLLDSLVYELRNHEFCITHDETEALESLGLTKEDVPEKILNMAKSEAMACQ